MSRIAAEGPTTSRYHHDSSLAQFHRDSSLVVSEERTVPTDQYSSLPGSAAFHWPRYRLNISRSVRTISAAIPNAGGEGTCTNSSLASSWLDTHKRECVMATVYSRNPLLQTLITSTLVLIDSASTRQTMLNDIEHVLGGLCGKVRSVRFNVAVQPTVLFSTVLTLSIIPNVVRRRRFDG